MCVCVCAVLELGKKVCVCVGGGVKLYAEYLVFMFPRSYSKFHYKLTMRIAWQNAQYGSC